MICEDICKYLESRGLGVFAQDLFANAFPQETDEGICIYDGVGSVSDPYLILDSPAIQIISRSSNSVTASNRAIQIYKQLHGQINSQQVNNIYVYQCLATAYPESIGRDENGLWLWSCNYNLKIKF